MFTASKRVQVTVLSVLAMFCLAVDTPEPGWQGAEQMIRIAQSVTAEPEQDEAEEGPEEQAELNADIDAFAESLGTLPADEAAAKWLALLERVLTQNTESGEMTMSSMGFGYGMMPDDDEEGVSFRRLIEVLPPPDSWDAIDQGIKARPAPGPGLDKVMRYNALRLFGSYLVGDEDGIAEALQGMTVLRTAGNPSWSYEYERPLREIVAVVSLDQAEPELVIKNLEKQLAQIESGRDRYVNLDVPDLVTLVGQEQAEPHVLRILKLNVQGIDFDGCGETMALARRMSLEHIDELGMPHWELINSVDSVALYEAFAGKFLPGWKVAQEMDGAGPNGAAGNTGDGQTQSSGLGLSSIARGLRAMMEDESAYNETYDSWSHQTARQYYVLGLIAAGRPEAAMAELKTRRGSRDWELSIPYGSLQALDDAGYAPAVYDFLHLALSEDPVLPVWQAYIQLAVRVGKSDQMIELAMMHASNEAFPPEVLVIVKRRLLDALLAADRLDDALAMLREQISENPNDSESVEKLLELGVALGDEALIEEAVPPARARAIGEAGESYSRVLDTLLEVYFERGELIEAERTIAEVLRQTPAPDRDEMMWGYSSDSQTELIAKLAVVYHKAGRHEDVLYLFDTWPNWGVRDLAEYTGGFGFYSEEAGPLLLPAAHALHAMGRTDEAEPLLLSVIENDPGSDTGYELLVEIKGESAIPFLDSLFQRDPFEERPLIWKAKVLLDAGQVDEAETTIKRAIEIDPSDGEQGRGDRMRAYRVLGEVARAKGDQSQVEFLKRVDDAIRLAEDADRLFYAGLLQRGIQMYQRSLEYFANAYCIQSRLAVQLAEAGRHEEAEVHYRRAYELMPDSFGRVESHCFGCEGVFSGELAQDIAERVFSRLIEERPESPKVHYLMGYLRENQGRDPDAVPHYLKAVELDPEYLNAWKHLLGVAEYADNPAQVREEAQLNLVRLDPSGGRSSYIIRRVVDLKSLWPVLERNLSLMVPKVEAHYPLPAAMARLDEIEKLLGAEEDDPYERYGSIDTVDATTPGGFLIQHAVLGSIAEIMD